jgi:hypothetical protein
MFMKRAIILGSALSVLGLMLVSCASSPEATIATTSQTTGTTPTHAPGGANLGGTMHQGTEAPGF